MKAKILLTADRWGVSRDRRKSLIRKGSEVELRVLFGRYIPAEKRTHAVALVTDKDGPATVVGREYLQEVPV